MPPVQKNAVAERLLLGLNFFHQLLGGNRRAQQGFQHRQQRLGFLESEGALGHVVILLHIRS